MTELKKPKRRIRNYFQAGTGQFSYGLIFASITTAVLFGLFIAYGGGTVAKLVECHYKGLGCDAIAEFDGKDDSDIAIIAGTAIVLIAISFGTGIVFSHKTFGPQVAINRHIKELINGNYDARVKLRNGDHFLKTSELLNELSEFLQSSRKRDEDKPEGGKS